MLSLKGRFCLLLHNYISMPEIKTSKNPIPDQRSKEMLALVVKLHITTGEPVGSRTISRFTSEGLSAATVRNIIADLEEAGFLEQPHTSAGRVPSDKGYRFYVDHILQDMKISESDESFIETVMADRLVINADQLMGRASRLLSELSNSVGIVISPSLSQDIINHIDFVRLNDARLVVITVSRSGIVQNRIIRIDEDLTQDELNSTANYFNSNFYGMNLPEIRRELLKRLSEDRAIYDRYLQNTAKICEQGLRETDASETEGTAIVFVEGAANIVTKSDISDPDRIRDLLRIFDEKSRLIKILTECLESADRSTVKISIGAENSLPTLKGCSVITSYYNHDQQIVGSLGIVGSVRMEYARSISIVNHVARLLEQTLGEFKI